MSVPQTLSYQFTPDPDEPDLENCTGTLADAEIDPFPITCNGQAVTIDTQESPYIMLGKHELQALIDLIDECERRGLP